MSKEFVFETKEHFRRWLREYGQTSEPVWLLFGKTTVIQTLSANDALEEALCFGWIDGLINSIDEDKYKKYFSRRRKGSNWSEKNKKLVEKLIQEKRMTEFGLAAINEAKSSGEWDKVRDNSISDTQKEDFESKISTHHLAYQNYLSMSPSAQKQFIGFYFDAKKEEARQRRIEKIITLLEQNKRLM